MDIADFKDRCVCCLEGVALNLNNKKIPVTGVAGFIGSHLTEELVKLGYA